VAFPAVAIATVLAVPGRSARAAAGAARSAAVGGMRPDEPEADPAPS
jgi:hypothetical protein